MKIESQGVSLELAREMKELGVPQDSIFAWFQYKNLKPYVNLKNAQNYCDNVASFDDGYAECPKEICDASTVAELGEMLPIGYRSYYYNKHLSGGNWLCNDGEILGVADAKTEVDARAKMLIYLIKEGVIKAEEVGK